MEAGIRASDRRRSSTEGCQKARHQKLYGYALVQVHESACSKQAGVDRFNKVEHTLPWVLALGGGYGSHDKVGPEAPLEALCPCAGSGQQETPGKMQGLGSIGSSIPMRRFGSTREACNEQPEFG